MIIRELLPADRKNLSIFLNTLSAKTREYWYHYTTANEVYEEKSYKLIALLKYKIVGLASLIPNNEYPDPSLSIVIADSCQKKGIGTKLMDVLEADGKELGYKAIFLTIFMDNEQGIHFYQKRGYKFEGNVVRKGQPCYTMRKHLNRENKCI